MRRQELAVRRGGCAEAEPKNDPLRVYPSSLLSPSLVHPMVGLVLVGLALVGLGGHSGVESGILRGVTVLW